jgi:hypothetical protein
MKLDFPGDPKSLQELWVVSWALIHQQGWGKVQALALTFQQYLRTGH